MNNTLSPACASIAASEVLTRVLPQSCVGPEIITIRLAASCKVKCRLVRSPRTASTKTSAGRSTGRKGTSTILCLQREPNTRFLRRLVFFHSHRERGKVAITCTPSPSSCSEVLMPRLSAMRTRTSPIEHISPNRMPKTMTTSFRGLMGSGCVTALSIIRTLPMALEREMFSSC